MRSAPLLVLLCSPVLLAAQAYTVMTYNIRYENGHDRKDRWELRKEALAATIRSEQPAILGLQEVLRDQLAYLKGLLPGYGCFGVGRDNGLDGGEFAPVFYDTTVFSLLEGRTVWLSPTPDFPSMGWDATCNRIVSLAILRDRASGDSLWVANSHWDAVGREARRQSARIVMDLLAGPAARGRRVIFMGDLNARSGEEPVRHLSGTLMDSCPKKRAGRGTFNGFKRLRMLSRRIDYIWLSPGTWSVEAYEVPHPKVKCRQVSDHFPVVVRLRPL